MCSFFWHLLVETCIPLGGIDFHTSNTPWLSASFLKYAVCWGGGVWHMIGVTGLLTPGLRYSCSRGFHKRFVDVGTKCLSQKEAFVITRPCLFQRPIVLVARHLSAPGSSN